jgi:hypothetical protein
MLIYENVPIKNWIGFKRVEPIEVGSHLLADYKWCPKFYFLKNVLGYKAPSNPIYITWGSVAHKFFHSLELNYKTHKNVELSIGLATIEAMKSWGNTKDPPPEDRKYGFMTKSRLSDLLVYVSKVWQREKNAGDVEVIYSEQAFNMQLPNGMWIRGRPDQLIRWNGRNLGRDFKFTTIPLEWYERLLKPSDQFARYTYAETKQLNKQVSGQRVDVFFMTRDKGPTFKPFLILYTEEEINTWLREQSYWKQQLDFSRENDLYPKNENRCSRCVFHKVCKEQTQSSEEWTLKSQFKFDPYDPERMDLEEDLNATE